MGIGIDSFDAGPAGKIHFARCNCLFHGHKCLQGWNRALGSSAWNVHVPDGNEAIFSNAWGHGLCVSSHNEFLSPTLAVVAVFPANDGNSKGFQVWKTRWWGLLECSSQCMWCRQHVAESSAAVLVWPLPTQLDWNEFSNQCMQCSCLAMGSRGWTSSFASSRQHSHRHLAGNFSLVFQIVSACFLFLFHSSDAFSTSMASSEIFRMKWPSIQFFQLVQMRCSGAVASFYLARWGTRGCNPVKQVKILFWVLINSAGPWLWKAFVPFKPIGWHKTELAVMQPSLAVKNHPPGILHWIYCTHLGSTRGRVPMLKLRHKAQTLSQSVLRFPLARKEASGPWRCSCCTLWGSSNKSLTRSASMQRSAQVKSSASGSGVLLSCTPFWKSWDLPRLPTMQWLVHAIGHKSCCHIEATLWDITVSCDNSTFSDAPRLFSPKHIIFLPASEHCTDAEFCLKRMYWTGNGAGKQDRNMEIWLSKSELYCFYLWFVYFFPQSLNEGFLLKNQADCNVFWEASCSYLDQGATLSGPIRTWTLMNFGWLCWVLAGPESWGDSSDAPVWVVAWWSRRLRFCGMVSQVSHFRQFDK